MKKVLLTLLALVVVVGVLAGAGFGGYRIGYRQGVLATSKADTTIRPFLPGNDFNWRHMPMHEFGHGMNRFHPGFGHGGLRLMPFGGGFGFFFSAIRLLIQLAILGFIFWLAYKLLTGWRLSLTRTTAENPRVEPAQPVEAETKSTEDQSN